TGRSYVIPVTAGGHPLTGSGAGFTMPSSSRAGPGRTRAEGGMRTCGREEGDLPEQDARSTRSRRGAGDRVAAGLLGRGPVGLALALVVGATLAAGPASTSAAAPPDDQAPAPSAHGSVTPPSEPPVGAVSTGGADRNPAAGPGGPGTAASAGLAGLALVSLGLTGIAAAGVRRTLHTWRGAG